MTGFEREDGQAKGQNDALGKNFRILIIFTIYYYYEISAYS